MKEIQAQIAIGAKNLSKIYDMGSSKVEAVKGVNLAIKKGEFVALTGTSGSGKSTLMHLLGGLDIPTNGEVFVQGKSLAKCKERQLAALRREKIGFVFQKFCLIQELSVRENIILPVLLSSRKVNETYMNEICDVLGLGQRLHHMPSELSGGQQQRVAIARALANKNANFDTKLAFFLFAQKALFYGLFQPYYNIKSSF